MNPSEMISLAKYLARKHVGPGGRYSPYLEDMAQEALLGILSAHAKFDATRNCSLKTICVTWGSQRIVRYLENHVYPLLPCVSETSCDDSEDPERLAEQLPDTTPRHDGRIEARLDIEHFVSTTLEGRIVARFRKSCHSQAREVALMRLKGKTLQEIGDEFGFSRERARQYLLKLRLDSLDLEGAGLV